MEKWFTIFDFMDVFFGFLAALGSIGSLVFVGMGYYLAKDYLAQHEKKITIERRRIAAENGLRALIKMDQVMSQFFSNISLAATDEYPKLRQLSISTSKKFGESHQKLAFKLNYVVLLFSWNFRRKHNFLSDFHKELKMNGMIIKDPDFERLDHEFDLSIDAITDFMLFQWDRKFKKSYSIEELESFSNEMPTLFHDDGKPMISDYNLKGENLKQFFLKYC